MYIILLLVITLAILFIKQRYNLLEGARKCPTWTQRSLTGNVRGLGTRLNLAEVLHSCYERLKDRGGPFGGIFFFLGPQVVATDLDFVKTILVRDFQYFHDRSLFYNERDDPLEAHLFTIEGSRWRALRAKLTPTFTSGKMKLMFPIVRDVAGELEKCLGQELAMDSNVEMKDILARFTTDVIGNCAFGLECNSLKNPGAEFREMGRRAECFEVLKHHGALSYDAVFDMKYLDRCISETLRMYPPAAVIFRTATKDYPETPINISVLGIHRDPELYPDPMKFDPERFNPDQVAKRHPFAYLPFGEGLRLCIGMRFAQMQTRVGLATLLQNFRFTVSPRTPIPPKIVPSSGLFVPQDNFWLNIERIE
ncbi:hypothetical protein quinque_011520 [Culex quinquefasciatus]